jgi:hypothetical protein
MVGTDSELTRSCCGSQSVSCPELMVLWDKNRSESMSISRILGHNTRSRRFITSKSFLVVDITAVKVGSLPDVGHIVVDHLQSHVHVYAGPGTYRTRNPNF